MTVLDYNVTGDESETLHFLGVKDRPSESYSLGYALAFLVAAIIELGNKRLILKSDNEPSILKLKDDASACLPQVACIDRAAPMGDRRAYGAAEILANHLGGPDQDLEDCNGRRH